MQATIRQKEEAEGTQERDIPNSAVVGSNVATTKESAIDSCTGYDNVGRNHRNHFGGQDAKAQKQLHGVRWTDEVCHQEPCRAEIGDGSGIGRNNSGRI